jgi:hypothetical protein
MRIIERCLPLCISYGLFVLCVALSGIVGLIGGLKISATLMPSGGAWVWCRVIILPAMGAILVFVPLYRLAALKVVDAVGNRRRVVFHRPSTRFGILCAAAAPLAIVLLFFLLYAIGVCTGSLRDSL